MAASAANKLTWILSGIVLLLTGALAGVLLTVARMDPADRFPPRPVAEQIRLGRESPLPAVHSDSIVPLAGVPEPGSLNQVFRRVARQVTPSVVYIEVEGGSGQLLPPDLVHPPFDGRRRDRRFGPPRQSVGSGVLVSEDGYVVTNFHVLDGADQIHVMLTDKRQYVGRVIGVDPLTDLAVLKIDGGEPFPVIGFGDSDSLTVGEWVLAVGNPFRLTSTVTAGIVSALGRRVNIIEDEYGIEDFIQTDAAINPGNSGGALVNMNGDLVGISTAIATESGSYEGYGFAVPVNLMQRVIQDLIVYGEVHRAILGVRIEEVTLRDARQNGMTHPAGALLHEVTQGSAAHRAGLRRGDVVVAIENRPITATNELQREIARYRPGDSIHVDVIRRGERRQFDVVLMGRDDPTYANWLRQAQRDERAPVMPDLESESPVQGSIELADWGVGFRHLSPRDVRVFGEEGAYVAYVRNGTFASRGGLPRDVLLTHVDDRAVESVEAAIDYLRHSPDLGESVLLRVKRRDGLFAFYEVDVPH